LQRRGRQGGKQDDKREQLAAERHGGALCHARRPVNAAIPSMRAPRRPLRGLLTMTVFLSGIG
jgi:hypothetical protein